MPGSFNSPGSDRPADSPNASADGAGLGDDRWWEAPLESLNRQQWEALCDGCGRCCLIKLEDDADQSLHFTSVVCELFDEASCRCTDYPNRHVRVPDCIEFDAAALRELNWLPNTCAYRLRAENKPLADWHPLVSGSADTVHDAGISVRGRVISEAHVHPDALDEFVIRWVSAR